MEKKNVSAIILSGGKSSRMGTDKCDLEFGGETLLNNQVNKMRSVGIEDIIAAGYRGENCAAKVVHDDIMKGPLSGILVGLNEIVNDRAVVVSVDVPLLKAESIKKMIDCSFENDVDACVINHNGKMEQLIGIFKKSLAENIKQILKEDNFCVMRLLDSCKYMEVKVDDSEDSFININYKDDYDKLLRINK